jgi:hypothetical protein
VSTTNMFWPKRCAGKGFDPVQRLAGDELDAAVIALGDALHAFADDLRDARSAAMKRALPSSPTTGSRVRSTRSA